MKKVVSGVLFFVILIVILIFLGFVFSPKYLSKNINIDKKSDVDARLAKEADYTLDIIVLGDSLSYSSISPLEWWRDYGYACYNFGLVGGKLTDVKKAYSSILKSQNPKLILLETNVLYIDDSRDNEANNVISSAINSIFPVTKYHENWKAPFMDKRSGFYKGFTISHTIAPGENRDYMIPDEEKDEIVSYNIETIQEINELCIQNGGILLLYSAPSMKNYNFSRHKALCALAADMNVEYVDLNLPGDDLKIDFTTDTRDGGDHLNVYGAIKATGYLGRYIHDNYSLPDRRGTDIAPSWNELLEKYIKAVNNQK